MFALTIINFVTDLAGKICCYWDMGGTTQICCYIEDWQVCVRGVCGW